MEDCIFSIGFTHENMIAAFVGADGVEADTAGFGLADFLSEGRDPLEKLIAMLAAKYQAAPHSASAAAISMPCDLDKARTTVLRFPEACWLEGQNLPEILADAIGIPVVMERRSIALLAFDMTARDIPRESLAMGCYMDAHYENAIWHRGAPMLGHNGAAGNIGHITIHDHEDSCFCGLLGCVDLYGSGVRLNQIHTMIFPDTPLAELFVRHGDHPILRDFLAMMAYPIAIEADILDPDFIILGGAIPAMEGFPRSYLEKLIRDRHYYPSVEWNVAFVPSAVGSGSALLPIARYATEVLSVKSKKT